MSTKFSISVRQIVFGLSSLLALSGQAMATTSDFGAQDAPSSLNFGHTFTAPQSQFQNDYTFSIPDASVNSILSTISLGNFFGISNLQTRLSSDISVTAITPLQTWWSSTTPITIGGVSGAVSVIGPVVLSAGQYVLEVSGDVVGTAGGSYSGILNISPVPETEVWVLMLSGLGLIGLLGARRRRNEGM
ncbi:MAG: FxDxF family PEP-CTERM protein [Sulfuricella sp.]|jgi:hypothetical protein